MNVIATLVADHEALHLVQPGEGALHDPAMPPELLTRLDLRSRDATQDATRPEEPLVLPRAIALVAVELVGPAPRPAFLAADRRDRVEELGEEGDFVDVRRRDELREGYPVGV